MGINFKNIKNFKSFLLTEENDYWNCDSIIEINDSQKKLFGSFCAKVSRDAKPVYRGVDNDYLEKYFHYGTQYPKNLATNLMMLGDKGINFSKGEISPLFLSYENCPYFHIWDEINKFIKNKDYVYFNRDVYEFFTKQQHRKEFVKKMEDKNLSEENHTHVLDYYCSFLHSINGNGDPNRESYCISTSTRLNVTKRFSNDGIVIYGWVPQNLESHIITYFDLNEYDSLVEELGFPIYDKSYYNQDEICLKCGFLPHYILGFRIGSTFFINPWLLRAIPDEKTINYGLFINQVKFRETLKKSGWYYSFSKDRDSDNYELDKNELSDE